MKQFILLMVVLSATILVKAQSPVGKWKVLSHTVVFDGKKMDMQAALLSQRPCAAKIIYEINSDATYRLNAAASGCDEKYKNIQQKLYSKTNWRVVGNKITTSTLKDFSVGQTYTFTISGSKMTWVGTNGQGTIIYQKL